MNSLHVIIFGVIVCCAVVGARQYGERAADEIEQDEYTASNDEPKHRNHAGKERHRRKRWQAGFGYHYPVPAHPLYYENDRRDYDPRQQDILPQIYRLLDEISAYVRRPQPPPVYVPYPVHVPMPQYPCNCPNARPRPQPQPPLKPDMGNVSFPPRWPDMSDENQNWGFVEQDTGKSTGNEDYDEDVSRPISFKPVLPSRPSSRKQPDVEHGSTQAGEVSPSLSQEEARLGGSCYIAIIRCCVPYRVVAQQQKCFADLGCQRNFNNGAACEYHNVSNALVYHEKLLNSKKN